MFCLCQVLLLCLYCKVALAFDSEADEQGSSRPHHASSDSRSCLLTPRRCSSVPSSSADKCLSAAAMPRGERLQIAGRRLILVKKKAMSQAKQSFSADSVSNTVALPKASLGIVSAVPIRRRLSITRRCGNSCSEDLCSEISFVIFVFESVYVFVIAVVIGFCV